MALVVDASVGLKWVLKEAHSDLAHDLLQSGEALLVPDFWMHEATSVLWLQVRKGLWSREEAREGLQLLGSIVDPTPTANLGLHALALELGMEANHSTCDTLYVAFAIAMRARFVVVADGAFHRDMKRHPDPAIASMLLPLAAWAG